MQWASPALAAEILWVFGSNSSPSVFIILAATRRPMLVGRSASSVDLDVAADVSVSSSSEPRLMVRPNGRLGKTQRLEPRRRWAEEVQRVRTRVGRGHRHDNNFRKAYRPDGSMSALACYQAEECDQSVVIVRHSPHDRVFVLLGWPVARVIAQQIVALR